MVLRVPVSILWPLVLLGRPRKEIENDITDLGQLTTKWAMVAEQSESGRGRQQEH